MNHRQAMAKLRKRYGAAAMYRVDEGAPVGEQIAKAQTEARAKHAAWIAARDARDARASALLAADPEFQALKEQAKLAGAAREQAQAHANRRRITVGRDNKFAFCVEAQCDNWDEVFAKLEGKA